MKQTKNILETKLVWSIEQEKLRNSNSVEIFLCNEGQIKGEWITISWTNKKQFPNIKKLINKYKTRLREASYLCDDEYMLYYQFQKTC